MSYTVENKLGEFIQSLQIHTKDDNDRTNKHLLEITDKDEAGETELEGLRSGHAGILNEPIRAEYSPAIHRELQNPPRLHRA